MIILLWLLIILLNLDWAGRAGKVPRLVRSEVRSYDTARAGPGQVLVVAEAVRDLQRLSCDESCVVQGSKRRCGIEKANQDQLSQPVDQVKEL